MKDYLWLIIVLIFSNSNVFAFQSKIEIVEQFDNLRMIAFINKEDIDNNPTWDPNKEAPPISISKAIQAVKDFNINSKSFGIIKEIEIRPVANRSHKWHYLIKVTNDSMKIKFDVFIVLMSGKVIAAIIEPEGYK